VKRFGRAARLVAVVTFVLLSAYTGIVDGLDTSRSATQPLERVAAASQLAYGGLAVATLVALPIMRRWVLPLLLLWGAALTLTGGLAPVVWGEQGALVGVLGGLCTAGIVALVVWACRRHNRDVAEGSRAQTEAG
jgi:hypothetical protein